MKLHELKPAEGSCHLRKRVDCGTSSGYGKTSGCRQKGQLACQGGHTHPGLGGSQMPLFEAMPRRGFKNINCKEYTVINLDDLNKFEDGNGITIVDLKTKGLVKKELSGVKSLASGELKIKVTVKVNKASKATEEAVNTVDGSVEAI